MNRFLMKYDLSSWNNTDVSGVRKISSSDARELGRVMYEAYQGTIDYSGETIDEATAEVEATSKGKGHAKNLLRASLSFLNKAGYSECCLFVTEGNEPAISIYKSLGFKVVI